MSWLSRRQIDGGIDRIPTPPDVGGKVWLCGKHAIGPDVEAAVADAGGQAIVVCLTEAHELRDRYPDYVAWLERHTGHGGGAIWWPVPDLHAPAIDVALPFVDDLAARLRHGDDLLIHCAAGKGRAGTTAVCVLIRLGWSLDVALGTVADHRPNAGPEVGAQRDLVEAVAALSRRADERSG